MRTGRLLFGAILFGMEIGAAAAVKVSWTWLGARPVSANQAIAWVQARLASLAPYVGPIAQGRPFALALILLCAGLYQAVWIYLILSGLRPGQTGAEPDEESLPEPVDEDRPGRMPRGPEQDRAQP